MELSLKKRYLQIYFWVILLCQAFMFIGCAKNTTRNETEGWGETQSLSVATDWAGIDFNSPEETFITDDGTQMDLTTYRYKTVIIEALYRGDGYELVFRRSGTLQGLSLAEDDKSYAKEWDFDMNGISVHCLGDGVYANVAFFDAGGDHFSVTCHIGNEDAGLTEKELSAFLEPALP